MKQFIICPECGSVELATIDTSTVPWWTYIHDCKSCGYTIMESEWDALPAISVRQPWSYLICSGLKDIENRTWKLPEKYKGQRVLIHAGAKPWTWQAVRNYLAENTAIVFERFGFNGTWLRNLQTSAIIGSVEIVDCVINHPSIWAEKETHVDKFFGKPVYNWVLKNPVLFDKPILNVKGKLGFFKPKID
jgi:hypothetical protein